MSKFIKNKVAVIFLLLTPFAALAQFVPPVEPDPIRETLNLFKLSFGNIFRWAVLIILFFTIAQFFYSPKEAKNIKSKKEIYWSIIFSILFFFMSSYEIFDAAHLPVGCIFSAIGGAIQGWSLILYFIFFSIFQINFWFIKKQNLKWDKILLIISFGIYLVGVSVGCYVAF